MHHAGFYRLQHCQQAVSADTSWCVLQGSSPRSSCVLITHLVMARTCRGNRLHRSGHSLLEAVAGCCLLEVCGSYLPCIQEFTNKKDALFTDALNGDVCILCPWHDHGIIDSSQPIQAVDSNSGLEGGRQISPHLYMVSHLLSGCDALSRRCGANLDLLLLSDQSYVVYLHLGSACNNGMKRRSDFACSVPHAVPQCSLVWKLSGAIS